MEYLAHEIGQFTPFFADYAVPDTAPFSHPSPSNCV